MLKPEIVIIEEKRLVGIKINTSLSERNTLLLWKEFLSNKHGIENIKNKWYYSVQSYNPDLNFENFNSDTRFDSSAAVEVDTFESIPNGMEPITVQKGIYAVFLHKGTAEMFYKTSEYIFKSWLQNSNYKLDNRHHFEIMKEKYLGPDNPNSEEEVWIPIK